MVGGSDGDLIATAEGERIRLPHRRVEIVDPTGGGDAFIGTLVALLASGSTLAEAGPLASAAAADTVGRLGGQPRFRRGDLIPAG